MGMIEQKQVKHGKLLKAALDAGVLAGAALFIFGLYLIWQPLAPLIGGLLLAVGCGFAGYDQLRSEREN
jgi:CHASE2 domain-containing sensor protein